MQHDIFNSLGYGRLDLEVGDWLTSNDIASFASVRQPEYDEKYCVRELLRILGKRFPTAESQLLWAEIEDYRQQITTQYAPPSGAIGGLSFEQAAHSWYERFGRQFEKTWYLQNNFALNYARVGHEKVGGRWLKWLHPHFLYFVEAGFGAWQILSLTRPLLTNLKMLRQANEGESARFWLKLSVQLMKFKLTEEYYDKALTEISRHANRLGINSTLATLDYFRRLELAGLDASVITG